MQFRLLSLCCAMALHAAAAVAAEPSSTSAPARPNILLILTDDMGYGDVGCYGGQFAPTPNLDRMAREGVRFAQYYSAAPICSPSRVGLTTGMFPARWQITSYLQTRQGNRKCEQADYLDPRAPSLARTLKSAGYATGHFGKWHMGGGRDVTNAPPFAAYGFDEHASTWESPQPHPDITATNWVWSPEDKVKRWDRTAFFVDKTLDFLRRHRDQPCYVNLWPDDTHTPWVPSQERLGLYPNGPLQERNFRAVLDEYDRQLGRLFAGLKELGLDERTLVIFTSDNGPLPSFRGSRSGGLRGSKLSLYEGGIRMPFVVRWPGHVPAGKVDEQTVLAATDLFPSLCAVAGVPLPKNVAFDGEDLSETWLGRPKSRARPLFWEYGRNTNSFAFPTIPRDRSPNVALRDGDWKLVVNADGTDAQLYDLKTDAQESSNLYAAKPEVAARLQKLALAWREDLPKPEPASREPVPGVVVDHQPQTLKMYVGSPSLAVLTNGHYVASHDQFGPNSTEHTRAVTRVFGSADRGATWTNLATIQGQFWSTLFAHRGALYLLGTDRHHGNAIIRRSTDDGRTWTTPSDRASGLLSDRGEFHCAPVPVLEHAGRLWRAIEHREPPVGWGITYCAGMLSIPIDADPINADNWTFSNFLPGNSNWLGGTFGGWLEGNAVLTPDGRLVDILRVDTPRFPEKAALVSISPDGKTASFDPEKGFVDFPGGGKKFAIRYDAVSRRYWTLANFVPPPEPSARPPSVRNTLALASSEELTRWKVHRILLQHPDRRRHGFQYVDWLFDGEDIIALSRTAFDDDTGGARSAHDANYLTFHRWQQFRAMGRE